MVFEWRAEAERRMREAGRPGMSEEQVRDFCARYMPAYRAYLPGLYQRASAEAGGDGTQRDLGRGASVDKASGTLVGGKNGVGRTLLIEVGLDRNPVG